ncbi:hypothetical protein AAC387_Pa02g5182 [Persea americana]
MHRSAADAIEICRFRILSETLGSMEGKGARWRNAEEMRQLQGRFVAAPFGASSIEIDIDIEIEKKERKQKAMGEKLELGEIIAAAQGREWDRIM